MRLASEVDSMTCAPLVKKLELTILYGIDNHLDIHFEVITHEQFEISKYYLYCTYILVISQLMRPTCADREMMMRPPAD